MRSFWPGIRRPGAPAPAGHLAHLSLPQGGNQFLRMHRGWQLRRMIIRPDTFAPVVETVFLLGDDDLTASYGEKSVVSQGGSFLAIVCRGETGMAGETIRTGEDWQVNP